MIIWQVFSVSFLLKLTLEWPLGREMQSEKDKTVDGTVPVAEPMRREIKWLTGSHDIKEAEEKQPFKLHKLKRMFYAGSD